MEASTLAIWSHSFPWDIFWDDFRKWMGASPGLIFRAGRVLGISCLIWGLLVLLSTQARSLASAMAVRVLLGAMEAVVTPGLNCEYSPLAIR